jgi:HSP20 family protein
MARNDPFSEIERVFEQLSRGLEGFEPAREFGTDAATDLAETDDAFELVVDLPGFVSEDIDVTLPDATTVRVRAERETTAERTEEDEDRRYVRQERRRQRVDRTLSLPERVDETGTTAGFENGVLTVTMPKRSEDEGADIDIE